VRLATYLLRLPHGRVEGHPRPAWDELMPETLQRRGLLRWAMYDAAANNEVPAGTTPRPPGRRLLHSSATAYQPLEEEYDRRGVWKPLSNVGARRWMPGRNPEQSRREAWSWTVDVWSQMSSGLGVVVGQVSGRGGWVLFIESNEAATACAGVGRPLDNNAERSVSFFEPVTH